MTNSTSLPDRKQGVSEKPKRVGSSRNKQVGTPSLVIDGYPFCRYRWEDGRYNFDEPPTSVLRRYLIDTIGICWYCSKPVKEYPHIDGQSRNQDDLATIEHLKPRPFMGKLGRPRGKKVAKVLSCYSCNQAYNNAHMKGKPVYDR